jgi:hypothetical protein
MTADSSKDVSIAVTPVDESAPLLSAEQSRYDGQSGQQQDEESSISSATASESLAKEVPASRVSPTAVVLVLIVGEFFLEVDGLDIGY